LCVAKGALAIAEQDGDAVREAKGDIECAIAVQIAGFHRSPPGGRRHRGPAQSSASIPEKDEEQVPPLGRWLVPSSGEEQEIERIVAVDIYKPNVFCDLEDAVEEEVHRVGFEELSIAAARVNEDVQRVELAKPFPARSKQNEIERPVSVDVSQHSVRELGSFEDDHGGAE